jgi:hypothetical protein
MLFLTEDNAFAGKEQEITMEEVRIAGLNLSSVLPPTLPSTQYK